MVAATDTIAAPSLGQETDCFRMYPNKQLDTDREKIRLGLTVEQCQEKCLHEKDFLCLSFDFIPEESVCITSPESAYTAPHMLRRSSKTDHYERMLDCEHFHLPDTGSLKQLKQPKQEQRIMVNGNTGSMDGVAVMTQRDDLVELHQIPDVPPKENKTGPALVFIGKNGRPEESKMKAQHKKDSHNKGMPDSHHPKDRHSKEVHLQEEKEESSHSILQNFIHNLHRESLREKHAGTHVNVEHESHGARHKRGTEHTHDAQEVPNHGVHSQHEDPRSRHAEEVHQDMASRHTRHVNSKEQYIQDHAINQKHIDAASQEELSRALHEERHQKDEHKRHNHRVEQLIKDAHREELLRVQHDETHHGAQPRDRRNGLRQDHLKSAHDEELMRVINEESRHSRQTGSGKRKHTLSQDHGEHPMNDDILRAALIEKLSNKHQGTADREHSHGLDERQLKSAHNEELLRVSHEEKHHKEQRNARHTQGLNEAHLKSAHEEELLRFTHEEKHHGARNVRSKHAFNEDHLRSATEEELLRVTHDERQHGTRQAKEHQHKEKQSAKFFDPSHKAKHTQHEESHVPDKRSTKHEGCGKGHDIDKRHLDAAQQEEVMRIKHDETHHVEPDKRRIKRHELNEDHIKRAHQDEMLRFKHEERHANRKRSHDDHIDSASREELMRVQEEERSSRHAGRGRREHLAFDENHLKTARLEELARIQHDEHFHERKHVHQNANAEHTPLRFAEHDKEHVVQRRHNIGLRQEHLDLAHQEELLRMRSDEDFLTEEERRLREISFEEESGSGSGTEPIGSGDDSASDEGSGSGNWHWGPVERFVEEEPVDMATKNKLLVEDSDVWDQHAD